uniref:ATP synthase subunit a n=1 Tax=Celleporella hyalina TaxID=60593 RepID=I6Q1Q3_9BILA|nr:ATP synthase F0 subunit 6 [Celleporella hyalina]AFJ53900.1 ATP synthase F0 subunit 6 [Celleporella hyalina]
MAMDLFSSFDDHNKVMYDLYFFIWFFMLSMVLMMNEHKLFFCSDMKKSLTILENVTSKMTKSSKLHNIKGSNSMISFIFFAILVVNFQGILPYTLGLTSQLVIVLPLALPLWLAIVMMSSSFSFKSFMAHFLPHGSPVYLNPFLCLVEFTSMMIRPLTLTVRVVANLSTGHILISLLASGCMMMPSISSMMFLLMGIFYMIFEFCVCVVQAYIFTLLPTLYGDEHTE